MPPGLSVGAHDGTASPSRAIVRLATPLDYWVLECHLLLRRECRDSVAEIDRTEADRKRNGVPPH